MLPILLSVVVISFSGVMMPGPMFAVTLAKSYKSPLAGAQISLGHAVIEVPLILLIYFGFAQFFQNSIVQLVLSILGGGMIIWLGISMFHARTAVVKQGKDLPYNAFTAGILTSAFNPFFLVWWATIGSMLIMRIT
ncbi:LysE family transporter, partial [Chloroflexota bacterium]